MRDEAGDHDTESNPTSSRSDTVSSAPADVSESVAVAETIDPSTSAGSQPSEPGAPLLQGTHIDGMQVMRMLGRGGMGEVYLARDLTLGRKVALKRLRSGVGCEVQSLMSEARALALCNHPHIVTIYAVGEFQGTPYLALEYLEGEDLSTRIRRKPPTVFEALRLIWTIADALAAAHGAGVLHRDLKPANVMLAADGRLRVVDFGLARRIDAERNVKKPRRATGTPGYMAPEQWRGEGCTPATDIWALGVMLYQMVSGRLPFPGKRARIIERLTTGPQVAPPLHAGGDALPPGLAGLVARCLSKESEGRPSLAEVTRTVDALLHPDLQAPDEDGPYRGLQPFTERHSAFFFGRGPELSAASDQLEIAPVVLVAGPSGAGKSSFVRAGLVPRMRERARWTVMMVRPGPDGFAAVARRLSEGPGAPLVRASELCAHPRAIGQQLRLFARRTHRPVLLFIDQFEEAFALSPDPQAADDFVEAICLAADDPADQVRVVATVREAFLGRLAARSAGRLALRHLIVLDRPPRSALDEILRRPLELVGYTFEDAAMVDEMIDAVEDSPARLPLLEFAARQLWDARDRDRNVLTRASLEAIGGVEGVLARHAERAVAVFPDPKPVRALCLRLVTAEATRRVVARPDLLDGLGPAGADALDRLIDARLVSARRIDGRVDIELTHESLITQWGRLSRWLEVSRDDLTSLAEAEAAATLWEQRGRRPSELWDGDALREARRAIDRVAEPPAAVRAFVDAGEAQVHHARRRRRAVLAGLVGALIVVAIVLAGLAREAEEQRGKAEVEAGIAKRSLRRADSEAQRARNQEAAALRASAWAAHAAGRPLEARARLRAALERDDHRGNRALWQTLSEAPVLWSQKVDSYVEGAALSPDGHRIALATQDNILRVFDLRDGREQRLRIAGDWITTVHWPAPDRLYVGTWHEGLYVVDDAVRAARLVPGTRGASVSGLAESVHGELVFVSGKTLKRCRQSCSAPSRITELPQRAYGATAAPSTNRFVINLGGGLTWLLDLDRDTFEPIDGVPTSVQRPTAFVDDETLIVGNSASEKSISLLEAPGGKPGARRIIWDDSGEAPPPIVPRRVAYDRTSGRVAVGDTVGNVWLGTLSGAFRLLGRHDRHVTFVGFSARGHLVSTSADGDLRLWRVPPPEHTVRPRPTFEAGSIALQVGANGRAVTSTGRTVLLWAPDGSLAMRWTNPERWGVITSGFLRGTDKVVSWTGPEFFWARMSSGMLARGKPADASEFGDPILPMFAVRGELWWADAEHRIGALPLRLKDDTPVGDPRLLAVSPSTPAHALIADGPQAGVWAPGARRPLWMLPRVKTYMRGGAFSPGGDRVALSRYGGVVEIADTQTGEMRQRFTIEGRRLEGIAFADEAVFVGDDVGNLHRWTLADGVHTEVVAHRGTAQEVALTDQNRGLLTVGDDGLLRRWDLDLNPVWRGIAIVDEIGGPWRVTHRGWRGAGDVSPTWADARWARAVSAGIAAAVDATSACVVDDDATVLRLDRDGEAGMERVTVPGRFGGREWPRVEITAGACLIATTDRLFVWPVDTATPLDVTARLQPDGPTGDSAPPGPFTALDDGFGVIVGERLFQIDARGAVQASLGLRNEATAVARSRDGGWFIGFADGSFGRYLPDGEMHLIQAVSSPVTALAEGPRGTWIVGHQSGSVAMWDLTEHQVLRTGRLHGAITHIGQFERRMVIMTELGDHAEWSMAALLDDYCAVLRAMWAENPAVWGEGRPVLVEPESTSGCDPTAAR